MAAKTIREVMTGGPTTVEAGAPISQVAQIMRDEGIGDVLVTDSTGLMGVVTDRDIVVRALAGDAGGDPRNTTVGDICSRELVTVNADADIDEAIRLMRTHAMRRLPVVDGGQLTGIVSIGDLAVDQDRRSALADISMTAPNS
ncbi:CBS domain-containing protein [Phytoactinopolyspora mesophila]|uniref:CBS domain-containing protein n=1 Tax=Phytoactinopolyspora mesophila TaxID=2650750 RepID=A0A7K3M0I3_9ACTN|nr:CBS domain-containing protein [Phytoactinopolyspora mesophila]NDL56803.1 CBS domain-containing protein [Phytoactinopolyspora mesophila]